MRKTQPYKIVIIIVCIAFVVACANEPTTTEQSENNAHLSDEQVISLPTEVAEVATESAEEEEEESEPTTTESEELPFDINIFVDFLLKDEFATIFATVGELQPDGTYYLGYDRELSQSIFTTETPDFVWDWNIQNFVDRQDNPVNLPLSYGNWFPNNFNLFDLDSDGVPELFINLSTLIPQGSLGGDLIYRLVDNEFKRITWPAYELPEMFPWSIQVFGEVTGNNVNVRNAPLGSRNHLTSEVLFQVDAGEQIQIIADWYDDFYYVHIADAYGVYISKEFVEIVDRITTNINLMQYPRDFFNDSDGNLITVVNDGGLGDRKYAFVNFNFDESEVLSVEVISEGQEPVDSTPMIWHNRLTDTATEENFPHDENGYSIFTHIPGMPDRTLTPLQPLAELEDFVRELVLARE